MKRCFLFILLLPTLWASAAAAQLTVVTDKTTYTAGEEVQIAIRNAGPSVATFISSPAYFIRHAGPSVATFISSPAYFIRHVESGVCIEGCVGLAVLWEMSVGEMLDESYDTSQAPDLIGHHEVVLNGASGDPGSILVAAYELVAPVSDTASTWGGVKSLFR